jgi:uncharacterized protein (TIGR01244 family)
MDVINWLEVEPGVYSAGQPRADQWQAVAASGVKTVVNLRPRAEQQEDEQAQVEAAGMIYHNWPVASLDDVGTEMAQQLHQLLEENRDGLLVHCASGNRVGALFAMEKHIMGHNVEDSMARGRAAGLTKLAPQMEMKLHRLSGCAGGQLKHR